MGPIERNVHNMETQLKLWAVRIEEIAAKAEKACPRAKIECRQGIDDLKARRAVLEAKIDDFKTAGSGKWEEFQAGIESAWSDLEAALRNWKF